MRFEGASLLVAERIGQAGFNVARIAGLLMIVHTRTGGGL
jgi:hypothetical protein